MNPRKVTKAVFPVAGMGTRFLPATKSVSYTHLTLPDEGLGVDLGGRRTIKKNY